MRPLFCIMKYKTNVNIKYRTPYIPKKKLPDEEIKTMRHEISLMRKNLIRKQRALERSNEFEHNPQLLKQLEKIKVRDIKSKKKLQNTWHRLYNLENSPNSSVTGKRETIKKEIESLHEHGYDFINKKNIGTFGEFMDYVRDNYSMKSLGSDLVVEYFHEHKKEDINVLKEGFDKYIRNFGNVA